MTTPKLIHFYLDFSSPYAYFAANWVDDFAEEHGCQTLWKPFLLGAIFKDEGSKPLMDYPRKGAYSVLDMKRSARQLGLPFGLPEGFPFMSVAAARAFYVVHDQNPEQAKRLAKAMFDETFGQQKAVGDVARVLDVAKSLNIDTDSLEAGLNDPSIKERLRHETDEAINKYKVFGAPFFIIDSEPFWGNDKRQTMSEWLRNGGW